MKKNRIRLTESQLHRAIKESVKKVLKEQIDNSRYIILRDSEDMYDSYWPRVYGVYNSLEEAQIAIKKAIIECFGDEEEIVNAPLENIVNSVQEKDDVVEYRIDDVTLAVRKLDNELYL